MIPKDALRPGKTLQEKGYGLSDETDNRMNGNMFDYGHSLIANTHLNKRWKMAPG